MYIKTLSVLATTALIALMGSKKFNRIIAAKEAVPQKIRTQLQETMRSCKDLNLNVPGALQAKALSFCGDL